EVGIDAAAMLGELDAPGLGDAEIGTLADHFRTNLIAADAQDIVGRVADVGVTLRRGLDVGANAAEPEQVDLALEDGVHQDRRLDGLRLDAEQLASLRAQLDRLL